MTTVTGIVLDINGQPSHCVITFESLSAPSSLTGGQIVAKSIKTIRNVSSDGSYSIQLEAGDYKVTFKQSIVTTETVFTISVPNGSSTIAITDLITTSLVYTYSAPPNILWNGQVPQDKTLTLDGEVSIEGNSGSPIFRFRYGGANYDILTSVSSFGNLTEATSSILTITGGSGAVKGAGTTIQVKQASGSQNGFLSSADWTTFNNKLSSITTGNFTENTSSVLTITGGTGAVIGSGLTVQVKLATTSVDGYLSHTDWNTFNGKESVLTFSGPLSRSTNTISIADAAADGATKGAAAFAAADFNASSGVISIDYTNGQAASGSLKGFLIAADWTTFNSKQAALGYTPVNRAGDTMTGDLTITGVSGHTMFSFSEAVTPSIKGIGWKDDSGNYIEMTNNGTIVMASIAGSTVGALADGSAEMVAGSTTFTLNNNSNGELDVTWTNGATVYTALRIGVFDSASSSSSMILDCQVGGGSVFSILKSGEFVMPIGAAAGYMLISDSVGRASWAPSTAGGTVTSVAMTVPAFLSVAGSPVTSSGTLAVTLSNQTANFIFAGPASGGAAAPTFRAMVSADLPSTITTVTWHGSVISEAYGGTNQSAYALGDVLYASATNTLSRLAGNTANSRKFLLQVGTGSVSAAPSWASISSGDVTTALGFAPIGVACLIVAADPETVTTANAGALAFNTNNSSLWLKKTGSGNTGWIQLI